MFRLKCSPELEEYLQSSVTSIQKKRVALLSAVCQEELTADAENVQHILEDKLPHFVGSFMRLCELFICQCWQQFVQHCISFSPSFVGYSDKLCL
jgi:hypothetical protein